MPCAVLEKDEGPPTARREVTAGPLGGKCADTESGEVCYGAVYPHACLLVTASATRTDTAF